MKSFLIQKFDLTSFTKDKFLSVKINAELVN